MTPRGSFSSRIGFIAAAAGSAVGLGNIWGFPYEVGQGGGGIFLIIYLFFCFAICVPVMLAELAIGRKTRSNAVGAFSKLGFSRWNVIGKLGVLSAVLILSFYNVIAAWAFGYIFEMAIQNFEVFQSFEVYTSKVLKIGLYAMLFLGTTSYFVSKGISGGIERLAQTLMPILITMIIGISIYSLTLPHAFSGLEFYLIPDISKISFTTAYNAMGQAFFSLSLGMGTLITFGSYVDRNENLVKSATLITLSDVGIAFLAGLMIFPLIGYMTNGAMDQVAEGPELIFVVLPAIFGTIGGTIGAIIGSLFFILLCFAALTSTVSMLEVPVSYAIEEFKMDRKRASIIVASVVFLVGIPSLLGNGYSQFFTNFIVYLGAEKTTTFLGFVVNLANDTFLPLGGFLLTVFVAYVWKKENLDKEIKFGAPNYQGSFLQKYLNVALRYIIPLLLSIVVIMTVLVTFFGY